MRKAGAIRARGNKERLALVDESEMEKTTSTSEKDGDRRYSDYGMIIVGPPNMWWRALGRARLHWDR